MERHLKPKQNQPLTGVISILRTVFTFALQVFTNLNFRRRQAGTHTALSVTLSQFFVGQMAHAGIAACCQE